MSANDDNNSEYKRLKLSVENPKISEENANCIAGPSSAASALSTNQLLTTKMFKLNVDCFEHLFEWLSLRELLTFRRTCKRMKQVVDYYIKLNYSQSKSIRVNQEFLDLCQIRLNYFTWIKHLHISVTKITADQADSIAYIFNQLESLKLSYIAMEDDFYDTILMHCKQLKYLSVKTKQEKFIGIDNEWLLRTYPTLEHFGIQTTWQLNLNEYTEPDQCSEVLAFLQLNSNIQTFSTNSEFLLKRCRQLLVMNVQIDRLIITHNMIGDLNLICGLANDFYVQGIYKRLHLNIVPNFMGRLPNSQSLEIVWKFNNLETLNLRGLPIKITIPRMESIKEIRIHGIESHFFESMATNFIHLKRVHMQLAKHRDIEQLIRYAPQLEQIYIWESFLYNFVKFNEERKKLRGARKVTIYINEDIFLILKWTNSFNFDLITLKRIESCEMNHIFHWDYPKI